MFKKLTSKESLGMFIAGALAGSSIIGFTFINNTKAKVGL